MFIITLKIQFLINSNLSDIRIFMRSFILYNTGNMKYVNTQFLNHLREKKIYKLTNSEKNYPTGKTSQN